MSFNFQATEFVRVAGTMDWSQIHGEDNDALAALLAEHGLQRDQVVLMATNSVGGRGWEFFEGSDALFLPSTDFSGEGWWLCTADNCHSLWCESASSGSQLSAELCGDGRTWEVTLTLPFVGAGYYVGAYASTFYNAAPTELRQTMVRTLGCVANRETDAPLFGLNTPWNAECLFADLGVEPPTTTVGRSLTMRDRMKQRAAEVALWWVGLDPITRAAFYGPESRLMRQLDEYFVQPTSDSQEAYDDKSERGLPMVDFAPGREWGAAFMANPRVDVSDEETLQVMLQTIGADPESFRDYEVADGVQGWWDTFPPERKAELRSQGNPLVIQLLELIEDDAE